MLDSVRRTTQLPQDKLREWNEELQALHLKKTATRLQVQKIGWKTELGFAFTADLIILDTASKLKAPDPWHGRVCG